MLTRTFCHLPGIHLRTERHLWQSGIDSWDAFLEYGAERLSARRAQTLRPLIEQSLQHLADANPCFFAEWLPSDQLWRLFADFRDHIAYVDIETTGMGSWEDYITTIALYDGRSIFYYVQGENLRDFEEAISRYQVIVTYNGKCFDVPFIERTLRFKVPHVHIDLRYVLKRLGYTGGLKGCERKLGLDRAELEDVDGYCAVLFWQEYRARRDERALETLLAYNIQDTVNLEALMVKAYNLSLSQTPFSPHLALPEPAPPVSPFMADMETVYRILRIKSMTSGFPPSRE
ncbi:MAG: ribonuclease H-like domain-containing protein [Candidatus Latescibacteria bacterium]|nr:ribonuclease H-like domain-containing protein [Candidatus Latescibacterota bacterium]